MIPSLRAAGRRWFASAPRCPCRACEAERRLRSSYTYTAVQRSTAAMLEALCGPVDRVAAACRRYVAEPELDADWLEAELAELMGLVHARHRLGLHPHRSVFSRESPAAGERR